MAIFESIQRTNIDLVVGQWRDRCLIDDGSLLHDAELWTADNLGRVYHNIVESPILDERHFVEKLEEQLEHDQTLVRLGAEALVVYYLFAWRGAVTAQTKRARVSEVLGWADEQLSEDTDVWRALGDDGIGHPGRYFLQRPDSQLAFVLDFARRLKAYPTDERLTILDDPWRLRDFADDSDEVGAEGMRHIVLHLLRPESFERIASGDHKAAIATTYGGLLPEDASEDVDERLLLIREKLRGLLDLPDNKIDPYEPPIVGTWGGRSLDGSDPIDALELKKQLVLFGPPGTSKTYEAKKLAEQIIRRHALQLWTPVNYFQNLERVDELVKVHVHRLQLHPAYSYEEFIRGLRLTGSGVAYHDGYLLRLIDDIDKEEAALPPDEAPLPWVLILDELNRADLSRVFGEAFSVLEDRDSPVDLPGVDPGEPPRKITMPRRLYLIGTMNLIDQSLEQIDFALRRRFLWKHCGFAPDVLLEVLGERWAEQGIPSRYPWDRLLGDMETFVQRAIGLNEAIARSPLLGRDYEVGHTYFFDVIGLLARADYMNRKTRASLFLWSRKGEARPPVTSLWNMSLEPLLDQYLQGIDEENRRTERESLRRVFLLGEA